jgi:CheY-like chemotaxis protein
MHVSDITLVLLVGGDADVYRFALGGYAMSVFYMQSAAGALELLDAAPFDVLVVDLASRTADGCTLVRHLRGRAQEPLNRIPTVALLRSKADERRALDAGFDRRHVKPCPPADLAATIRALCLTRHVA